MQEGGFMTIYYYNDPLAAAWMAKNFGMKFHENGIRRAVLCGNKLDDLCEKFEVHPDSLHLLEPQREDVIECISQQNVPKILCGYYHEEIKIPVRIIQRNGIAFMIPESEEV